MPHAWPAEDDSQVPLSPLPALHALSTIFDLQYCLEDLQRLLQRLISDELACWCATINPVLGQHRLHGTVSCHCNDAGFQLDSIGCADK